MNEYKTIILNKINRRDAHVAVIGLGYVGLPLAVALARAGPFDFALRQAQGTLRTGFRTIGLDLDQAKVTALNAGTS
jgi:UDP-N-acetyl-D-glucosamine dehydrogenase